MGVEVLTGSQVAAASVEALGLDPAATDFTSPEALVATLRRAASFRCPVTPSVLVTSTTRTLEGLAGIELEVRSQLSDLVDAMVALGDLLDLPELGETDRRHRTLYLGPPAFVRRLGGSFLLLGIRPEGAPLVGDALISLVEHERHLRVIRPRDEVDVAELLAEYGLQEIEQTVWLRAPQEVSPQELIEDADLRLDSTGLSGDVAGLRILDSEAPLNYYRGRWRSPTTDDSGRYVARRPQAFGSELWCYVELVDGQPTRFVDLPFDDALTRGSDGAWRLQAALDATRDHPELIKVERISDSRAVLSLYAPPPTWLQRRWDGRGLPLAARGALVSYALQPKEVDEEVAFAKKMLWLEVADAEEPR